jgi:predicted membrane metal-binding protein
MDEEQSIPGTEVKDDGREQNESRSPEQIRVEIERTREELGDTAAALAQKTDLTGQAKRAAQNAKDNAGEAIAGVKETVTSKVDEAGAGAREATPESAAQAGQQATRLVRENRTAVVALAALVLGVLIGRRR